MTTENKTKFLERESENFAYLMLDEVQKKLKLPFWFSISPAFPGLEAENRMRANVKFPPTFVKSGWFTKLKGGKR